MVNISFTTDNAAFHLDDGELDNYEVARCLEDIAVKIKLGLTYGKIHDYNGNYVGDWKID